MSSSRKNATSAEQLEHTEDAGKKTRLGQLETTSTMKQGSGQLSPSGKNSLKLLNRKYVLRPSASIDRDLRPRSQAKNGAPHPSINLINVNHVGENKQKRSKKKRTKEIIDDEFSRIRRTLRYLLNRMNYEQTLIDAYSGEGWKGQSLEKLKPARELQRATSEILRRKLATRDLFQRLDTLCTEGRLPISSLNSEGNIFSGDIMCAKCGSKEVSADNGIILCDGVCDSGFHQHCLEPPLLKQDLPPSDVDWHCPRCDCKDDCIRLLNYARGTNLSMSDSWEKVFPEVSQQNQDANGGPSSDDSEDDDYNPDSAHLPEKVQKDESSSNESQSDESNNTSASDDFDAPPNDEQYTELPPEDSEDDDYDADAPDLDEKVKEESSSSDFTSESEDFDAILDDKKSSRKDDSRSHGGPVRHRSDEVGVAKNPYLNNEVISISEADPTGDEMIPVREKRHVERLDYKKLHDETYGNVPTDSSDEESWSETDAPRKRNNGAGVSVPSNMSTYILKNTNTKGRKHKAKETACLLNETTPQKQDFKGTDGVPSEPHNGSPNTEVSGSFAKSAANQRLGKASAQRLQLSFKENQYPDNATKDRLAAELKLTVQQVSKWFNNTRWSSRHSLCTVPCSTACKARYSSKKRLSSISTNNIDSAANGDEDGGKVLEFSREHAKETIPNEEGSAQNSSTPNSRKRKEKMDQPTPDLGPTRENALQPCSNLQDQSGQRETRRKSVV